MKPCKLETKTTPAPAGMHRVSIHYYMAYPGAEKKKKAPAAKKKAPAAKKKAPSKRASKNVTTRKPRKMKNMSTALVPYNAPIWVD